nr:cytochrome P450 87A3-like isoform X1 [Ipomoea trifida]
METIFSSSMDELRKMNVSAIVYSVCAMLSIYIAHWIYRWRNPKCNGVLPPGSMGLPFMGETLQLIIPTHSLALPPFINTRIKRYGSMFKTNVAGRSVIVSADTDFNSLILKQDGKMVETWAMDTFAQVFENQEMQSSMKYIRHLVLNHFGVESLRDKLLPQIETFINHTLHKWSTQDSVEVKSAAITAAIDFAAKEIFSGDLENAPFSMSEMYRDLVEGLMSFPINLPGTAHHKCLQIHKKVRGAMRDVVKKRLETPERQQEDVLDHMIRDMGTHKFLSEDFIVQLMFGLLFVASESITTTLALAFKLLAEHPNVLEELTAEHDTILKNRENPDAPLTWNEYKSMTFTLQVINEVLRLGNIAPGLFRRAIKDIHYNGYTIPSGWVILIATAALHLNSDEYEDPLAFNPWRWQKIQQNSANKHFMPFGSGMKQCAGAEYSRVFLATFLHNLVTNYKWKMVKGGKIVRAPIIRFPDGFHFHISKKN